MTFTPQEVFDKLGGLEPDEIARLLQDLGTVGRRKDMGACPVARYVQRETGVGGLCVNRIRWRASLGRYDDARPLPDTVAEFVQKFDAGDYPDLIHRGS
jgi:hypothetical protein